MKYHKCVPCSQAVVNEHGEHPVEQGDQETRRGIDEKVKKVIDTCIQRSVRTVRPIDVFVHLNLQKTRNDEMKDLPQPSLTQIQTYIKAYRMETIGVGAVTTEDIKAKIKANMFILILKMSKVFFLGMKLIRKENQSSMSTIFELLSLLKNYLVILIFVAFLFITLIIHIQLINIGILF